MGRSTLDNLTHSLAGLAIAKLASRSQTSKSAESRLGAGWHRWIVFVSILANNFPDIDLVYSTTSKLDYLVHHRGHTHTFVFVLPIIMMCLMLSWIWTKKAKWNLKVPEWQFLAALSLVGGMTHLALDSTNNYGIHPFWPLENSWYYGDTIFILEPWLWIGLAVFCFHEQRTKLGRGIMLGIYALSLVVSLASHMVPWGLVVVLLIVGLSLFLIGYFLNPTRRIWPGFVLILTVYVGFWFCKREAQTLFKKHLMSQFPSLEVLDISIWPAPANPFCWTALGAMRKGHDYVAAKAIVGPLFQIGSQSNCNSSMDSGLASLDPINGADTEELKWIGSKSMNLEDLAHLKTECDFVSLMSFSRMPFWSEGWFGDLRYDHGKTAGFAVVDRSLSDSKTCPKFIPNWNPPRRDLF